MTNCSYKETIDGTTFEVKSWGTASPKHTILNSLHCAYEKAFAHNFAYTKALWDVYSFFEKTSFLEKITLDQIVEFGYIEICNDKELSGVHKDLCGYKYALCEMKPNEIGFFWRYKTYFLVVIFSGDGTYEYFYVINRPTLTGRCFEKGKETGKIGQPLPSDLTAYINDATKGDSL